VDQDKSTFYVKNDDNRWTVSGREFNKLFEGTSQMNRRLSDTFVETIIDNVTNIVTIKRNTGYIRGPVIKDTYIFDGKLNDVELFPIEHTVEIFNGSGLFYRYEVRDLIYDGDTMSRSITEMEFGRNMKVTWQDGFRWARVFKSGILKVQYDIPTDYEVYNVRLFDPPVNFIQTCQLKTVSEIIIDIINTTTEVYDECTKNSSLGHQNCLNTSGPNTDCSIKFRCNYRNITTSQSVPVEKDVVKEICRNSGVRIGSLQTTCPANHRCDVIRNMFYVLDCDDGDCNFDATQADGRGWSSVGIPLNELKEGSIQVANYKRGVEIVEKIS